MPLFTTLPAMESATTARRAELLLKSQNRQTGCVSGSRNRNTVFDGFTFREEVNIWRSRILPLDRSGSQDLFRICCRVTYRVPANGLDYKTMKIAGVLNRG